MRSSIGLLRLLSRMASSSAGAVGFGVDFLARDADHAEALGKAAGCGQVIQRRHKEPVSEVAAGAENDHQARGKGSSGCDIRRPFSVLGGRESRGASPRAASPRSFEFRANGSGRRGEVAKTSAGIASSMAAWMVQRPSPESATFPSKPARLASSLSALAMRSRSQDETTLPRRQTSAISGRSSESR